MMKNLNTLLIYILFIQMGIAQNANKIEEAEVDTLTKKFAKDHYKFLNPKDQNNTYRGFELNSEELKGISSIEKGHTTEVFVMLGKDKSGGPQLIFALYKDNDAPTYYKCTTPCTNNGSSNCPGNITELTVQDRVDSTCPSESSSKRNKEDVEIDIQCVQHSFYHYRINKHQFPPVPAKYLPDDNKPLPLKGFKLNHGDLEGMLEHIGSHKVFILFGVKSGEDHETRVDDIGDLIFVVETLQDNCNAYKYYDFTSCCPPLCPE